MSPITWFFIRFSHHLSQESYFNLSFFSSLDDCTGLCCDDSNFKNYLTKKMIVPILLFLSAPPKLLSRSFIIAGQERANLYLFVTCISSLHCHNDALFGRKHRNFFCDVAVNEYNKAADAIAIGHPTEPTVFPAFVKKNLEAIGRHLGDGIREGRENPFVTEEDVSLFEDFVRIFLSRCEKKEKKHPVRFFVWFWFIFYIFLFVFWF